MWRTLGQEGTVEWLSRSIGEGAIHHAYLFLGPEHVGKMTLALDLACALNCESDAPPCGECNACKRILEWKHADILVPPPASEVDEDGEPEEDRTAGPSNSIRIKQMRNLDHMANLPPFEGKWKVILIDDADRMTVASANYILKTLEEPPAHVVWMLLARNENSLLDTIISRCQRVDVRPIAVPQLANILMERYGADEERANLLARVSGGRTGWAISAMQDDSAMATRASRLESIIQLMQLGPTARFDLSREMDQQYRRDQRAVLETLDVWTTWWRDLMMMKTGCADTVVNVDYVNDLEEQAQSLTLELVRESIANLDEAREDLALNVIPRLVFDSLFYSIPRVLRSTAERAAPTGAAQDKSETE
jgi:DNA polymerase-3 subunit delta'